MSPQISGHDRYRSVLAGLDSRSRKISTFMLARTPCIMALVAGSGMSLSVCRRVSRIGAAGPVLGAAPAADYVELRRRASPCALFRLPCTTAPHTARFSSPYIVHSRAQPASSHLCARARRQCLSAPCSASTVAAFAACPPLRCIRRVVRSFAACAAVTLSKSGILVL